MITRKINENEYFDSIKIFSRVFEQPFYIHDSKDTIVERIKTNPQNRKEKYFMERYASFENDTMLGFMINVPFDVYFDGNVCKLAGIGDVATLPESRGKGVINSCFNLMLNDLYDCDYTFSYLYPFSERFYRKYGYEKSLVLKEYEIDFNCLQKFSLNGKAVYVDEPNLLKQYIKEVRNNMEKHNLYSLHEDVDDIGYLNSMNWENKNFNYVYLDENGTPKGYIRYKKKPILGVKVSESYMDIEKFIFSDEEGLQGLLSIAQMCSTTYGHLRLKIPSDLNIDNYLIETRFYKNTSKNSNHGMIRVVNVEKALEQAKYIGSGEISIKINDKQIARNNKIFKVKFENGKCYEVLEDTNYDVELSINDFSSLIVGSVDDIQIPRLLNVNEKNIDKVRQIFYKKIINIVDQY